MIDEIPVVTVPQELLKGKVGGHITFLTPECFKYIKLYLKHRIESGEELSENSYLIVAKRGKGKGKPITIQMANCRFQDLVKLLGFQEKGRRWYKLRPHGLRKYFKTWCELSGVPSLIVEFFMGHKMGIQGVYFAPIDVEEIENPELIHKFKEEYKKAITNLTISDVEAKLKELEEKRVKIEAKTKLLEEENEKLKHQLNELEESHKLLQKRLRRFETFTNKIMELDEEELIYLVTMLRRLRTARFREEIKREMAEWQEEDKRLMTSVVKRTVSE
ncbi:MAG: tyrosine-type recombinase/integrase [Armatimonadetes bacterium]|nr:tyrosine-type recombinase/integrase [Armatimonadota bacterium]